MSKLVRQIYISRDTVSDQTTNEILQSYPDRQQHIIPDSDFLAGMDLNTDPKNVILLTRSKGELVKGCPGTAKSYLCCRYQVINQTLNCPMRCSYCILQYYLNQPGMVVYTDFDKILTELDRKLRSQPARFFRVGTGELGDSLALPASRLFAKQAIRYFSQVSNGLLELKTKSKASLDLLDSDHRQHTVLSWSLNPTPVIRREEKLTASLKERLAAARQAQEKGFLLGFHFDPVILHLNWRKNYAELIERLYNTVDPARIAWISIGSLRFPPSMQDQIRAAYPHSTSTYAEMIRGKDGKLRYLRPLRVPVYQFIYNKLTAIAGAPFIYFCMESPLVWREVTGTTPRDNAYLDYLFANSLYKRFDHLKKMTPPRLSAYQGAPNLDGREF